MHGWQHVPDATLRLDSHADRQTGSATRRPTEGKHWLVGMLDESKTADNDMMIIVMGDADMNRCGDGCGGRDGWMEYTSVVRVWLDWNYVVHGALRGQAQVYRGRGRDRRRNEWITKGQNGHLGTRRWRARGRKDMTM